MRHCAFCGNEQPDYAQFCGHCGRLSTMTGERPQEPIVASSTWSSQNEPTIISSSSQPTLLNEQTVLHSQQAEPTLLTPSNSAIWTPPLSQQSSIEE